MKPNKWTKSDIPKLDDIVLFIYLDGQKSKEKAIWKLGKVIDIAPSLRKVTIAYPERTDLKKIPTLRIIVRSIREVSVIYSVDEFDVNTVDHHKQLTM